MKANRLGEMLLEAGLIDQFQLESALSMQRNLGGRLGSALVKLGYLPEETIMEFLESQSKFSRVSLQDLEIPLALIKMLPSEKMQHLLVVPIELRQTGNEKNLRVAMTDPTNQQLIDDLQFSTGCRVLPVLASEEDIRIALKNNLPSDSADPFDEFDIDKAPDLVPEDDEGFYLDQMPQDEGVPPEEKIPAEEKEATGSLATCDDARLDRLLDVLQKKGILSDFDIKLVKSD